MLRHYFVPWVGLEFFREQRRCLHDLSGLAVAALAEPAPQSMPSARMIAPWRLEALDGW